MRTHSQKEGLPLHLEGVLHELDRADHQVLHVVRDVPPLVVRGIGPALAHVFGVDRLGAVKAAAPDRLLREGVVVVALPGGGEVPLAHDARAVWRAGARGDEEGAQSETEASVRIAI